MRVQFFATAIAIATCCAGPAFAQGRVTAGLEGSVPSTPAAYEYESYYANEETAESNTSNTNTSQAIANYGSSACCGSACGSCCDPCGSSCCDPCNTCCDPCSSCCDSCCGCGGEAFSLRSALLGDDSWLDFGGWTQVGYTSESTAIGNAGAFNTHPDAVRLHQQWLYVGHQADGSAGLDFGFWFDAIYGVDAQDTQAFGNNPGVYDFQNGLDHGIYGYAFPQLYGEVAVGDQSVKIGHFYTIIGYEVVQATGNFFFSHSYTMYNTEPFTHTGALATYALNDAVTLYGGWTLGWDTGFDQVNQGNNFLGGIGLQLTDAINFTYATTAGNFGDRSAGNDGYMQSLVFNVNVTENLNYILQSDLLRIDATGEDDIGINQYLIYSISDRLGVGGRAEWWKDEGTSYYEVTGGINARPIANMVFRPEIRHNWVPGLGLEETIFGIDTVLTY